MVNAYHLQGLLHTPYGLGHPYERAPAERFPRDPIAGQPVTLGVVTWPAGAAGAVWAGWTVEGLDGEGKAEGCWVEDDEGRSHWRVHLPPFRRGQRVTYRLYASRGDRRLESDAFSFVVAGWCSIEDVVEYHLASDCLELECECSNPGWRPRVTLTFPAPHVLQLRLAASATGSRERSSPERPPTAGRRPADVTMTYRVLEETAERIVVVTQDLRVAIHRRPYGLEVSTRDGSSILVEEGPLAWLAGEDNQALRVHQTFASPPGEAFYGFGERYNALDQRGNTLDVRVFDQYKSQGKRTYLPVPFSLSSRGYGLYLATNRHVAYDLAASRPDRWSFDAELGADAVLEYYLVVGEDPQRIIDGFTDLVGKPTLPPKWAFGPWMSGNEWNSQRVVMEQVQKTVEHRIPATVLVIEAWSDEATFYIWNDARYEPKPGSDAFSYEDFTFPRDGRWFDPKGLIDELHRLGIRVLLWQIPVMKALDESHPQHDRDEMYVIENEYCVREADGRPYRIRPLWFHGGLVLDFTNPAAVQWWLSKRAYLLDDLGIDGFKTDGGEHLWGRELRFADGRRGDELWNLYPNLYVGAHHRFVQEKRQGDGITFSRAGFTGAQAYPCHWAGDENSTWEAFRASILAGLNAGISGIPFWGWDLAGFSGEIPSAELYLRAAAMAAFCPIMQYHSEFNEHRLPCRDRTPWNVAERTGDPDVISVYRFYANVRMNLLPYIYSEAWHSARTGLPLMRATWLEYPDDPICRDLEDQYFFGRALLVAPVLKAGARHRRVYLPQGRWFDLWSQAVYEGASWISYAAPRDVVPVFVREGAVLPINAGETCVLGSPVGNALDHYEHLLFRLYPAATRATYDWHDGLTSGTYRFVLETQSKGDLKVALPPLPYPCTLLVPDARFRKVVLGDHTLPRVERLTALADDNWYGEAGRWIYVRIPAARVSRRMSFLL
ncbi:MAG: glycosyl hydrolase family 31 [Chloroflexi bacterium]|nr:MAG: glycosyl hydrolase family 31 [Chloroflexota bacterium]